MVLMITKEDTTQKKNPLSPEAIAMNSIADELYEMRKENREVNGQLRNIADSIDLVSQYLYDISWELKKKNTLDNSNTIG